MFGSKSDSHDCEPLGPGLRTVYTLRKAGSPERSMPVSNAPSLISATASEVSS